MNQNREFKFRVWNGKKIIKNDELIKEVVCIHPDEKDLSKVNYIPIINFISIVPQCDFVLQQFTGLKDKNNKEIYEGDIVKRMMWPGPDCRNPNHKIREEEKCQIKAIKWGNYWDGEYVEAIECWMFGDIDSLSECIHRTKSKYQEWSNDYEIIGNIFENPDLI